MYENLEKIKKLKLNEKKLTKLMSKKEKYFLEKERLNSRSQVNDYIISPIIFYVLFFCVEILILLKDFIIQTKQTASITVSNEVILFISVFLMFITFMMFEINLMRKERKEKKENIKDEWYTDKDLFFGVLTTILSLLSSIIIINMNDGYYYYLSYFLIMPAILMIIFKKNKKDIKRKDKENEKIKIKQSKDEIKEELIENNKKINDKKIEMIRGKKEIKFLIAELKRGSPDESLIKELLFFFEEKNKESEEKNKENKLIIERTEFLCSNIYSKEDCAEIINI